MSDKVAVILTREMRVDGKVEQAGAAVEVSAKEAKLLVAIKKATYPKDAVPTAQGRQTVVAPAAQPPGETPQIKQPPMVESATGNPRPPVVIEGRSGPETEVSPSEPTREPTRGSGYENRAMVAKEGGAAAAVGGPSDAEKAAKHLKEAKDAAQVTHEPTAAEAAAKTPDDGTPPRRGPGRPRRDA